MPSYWIRTEGVEGGVVRLEGVKVDAQHSLMIFPYRPAGCRLGRCVEVMLDDTHSPVGKTVKTEEVENLPPDTVLMMPEQGTEFMQIQVKPLGEGAVDPLTVEEKELLGGKGKLLWTETVDEGGLGSSFFEKAPVLTQTLVDVRAGEITTTNDLYARLD
jgi:hypothetical protein